MLTSITLENFKGISAPATIPLRPLTIMFGKNSAGKSTVVQALHYAREIFERGNLNADRTLLGGSSVDLGGFRNLVNNHDSEKAITIRFDMDLRETDLPFYDFAPTYAYRAVRAEVGDEITSEELDTISGRVMSAAVELKIEWSEILERPVLTNYKTLLNQIEAVKVSTSPDEKNVVIEYNAKHPLLYAADSTEFPDSLKTDWMWIGVSAYEKALPEKGRVLVLDKETYDSCLLLTDDIRLTQMLVGPTDLLREHLASFRYIGPLRDTPPRNFQPALTENESDWANGLAAWRELYNDASLAELWVSGEWLSRTGYSFRLSQHREIPLESPLMLALDNNTVFDDIADTTAELKKYPIKKKLVLIEEKSGLEVAPHDIGVGISQVVPVVVAAFASDNRIIAIEQPELHLHPAVQAELGDLFIQSALGDFSNFFIIETHSEHLILRILRRIREYAEGEQEDSSAPAITPGDVQLIYVEPAESGTIFYNLPVTKEGDFAENVPGGFFAERAKELF